MKAGIVHLDTTILYCNTKI